MIMWVSLIKSDIAHQFAMFTPPAKSSRYSGRGTDAAGDLSHHETANKEHEKKLSLASFDPLSSLSNHETTRPAVEHRDEQLQLNAEGNDHLANELRKLAAEFDNKSPARDETLTPTNRVTKKLLRPIQMPWQRRSFRHRRTKSQANVPDSRTPPAMSSRTPLGTSTTINGNDTKNEAQFTFGPRQVQSFDQLAVPTLAQVRPSSFLTGREALARTNEADATEWQLNLSNQATFVVLCNLLKYMELNRHKQDPLDYTALIGHDRLDLKRFSTGKMSLLENKLNKRYMSSVEDLLMCGQTINSVLDHVYSKSDSLIERREVLFIEQAHDIVCLVQGNQAEQIGKVARNVTKVLADTENIEVLADVHAATVDLIDAVFTSLDRLVEENPFCDVVFSGHGFGASIASLLALKYAHSRPAIRVASLGFGHHAVGMEQYRCCAHSLPNLNLVRFELGNNNNNGKHCCGGHIIRLTEGRPVMAYRFGLDAQGHLFSNVKKEADILRYQQALNSLNKQTLSSGKSAWPQDFFRYNGTGVRGNGNETREMS